jgi:hypothetical protein
MEGFRSEARRGVEWMREHRPPRLVIRAASGSLGGFYASYAALFSLCGLSAAYASELNQSSDLAPVAIAISS